MNFNKSQNKIIRLLLRKGSASKKELSFALSLTAPALSIFTKPMIEEGLIVSTGKKGNGKAGRKEELLSLNPDYGYFLGCDFKARYAIVSKMDLSGKLLYESRYYDIEEAYKYIKSEIEAKKPLGIAFIHRKRELRLDARDLKARVSNLYEGSCSSANNVETLGRIYHFYHEDEPNFLLIKYGPGLGSCIYVNNAPIVRKNGTQSEIGHAFLMDGTTLEERVSFSTLLGKDIEEKEGAPLIYQDKEVLSKVIESISLALIDADALLALDKIIFAGILLSKEDVKEMVKTQTLAYNHYFPTDKISVYPDYERINASKACLEAFFNTFPSD